MESGHHQGRGHGLIGTEVIFSGDAGDVNAILRDPAAGEVALSDCTTATDVDGPLTVCTIAVDAPTAGAWTLRAQASHGTSLDYRIFGRPPADAATLYPLVTLPPDYALVYPAPVLVTAGVFKDALATDIEVVGSLQASDGTRTSFALRDDGVAPDQLAGDGRFAAALTPEVNGKYVVGVRFANPAGSGEFTVDAMQIDSVDGTAPVRPENTTIGTNFVRYAEAPVTITGAPLLGPNGERGGDVGIVELTPDNVPARGRVIAGRPTTAYFVTIPTDFSGDFFIRVSDLQEGMIPYVTADLGESWSREGTVREGESDITWQVSVIPGAHVIVEVGHADVNATAGLYAISAGPRFPTDHSDGAPEDTYAPLDGTGKAFLPLIVR